MNPEHCTHKAALDTATVTEGRKEKAVTRNYHHVKGTQEPDIGEGWEED